MVLKNNFSVFLIYEREQSIGYGYTDQIHIALGYLPDNKINYALKVDAKDDLKSKVLISKKIGDYKLSFDHSHDFLSEEDIREKFDLAYHTKSVDTIFKRVFGK